MPVNVERLLLVDGGVKLRADLMFVKIFLSVSDCNFGILSSNNLILSQHPVTLENLFWSQLTLVSCFQVTDILSLNNLILSQ